MIHTDIALRRPITTVMVFLALTLIGLIATKLLPLEQFPDITFPGMQVTIPYAGSTPEEIEELITRPVEEALSTLSGIKELQSTSRENEAEFQIQFDWGTDIEAVSFEVRTKLDSVRGQLPAGADRMLIFAGSFGDQPVVKIRLAANQDLSDAYDVLERHLKRPLERLDGVARVELAGVEPREVRILVDAGRVAAHGVDLRTLRSLLERSNFSVSAGEITERGQRMNVRPIGEFRSVDDVRNLLVQDNVRLSDIAEVELMSPELTIGRHLNQRPAVGLEVYKTTQANIVDVVTRVLEVVDRARGLPQLQGIEIINFDNQAQAIVSSLKELRTAGLIGATLAFVVLFLFLRDWPTTIIVALAVPFSLVITLSAMYFLDLTINILSMMGLMLAIGMLVDNAVVITESIFRHRQLNPDRPIDATLSGVRDVGVAVLAGTMSSVAVFLPLLFGERVEITVFLAHVTIPIVVAMIASLVVAQTIVPMLAARFPAPPPITSSTLLGRLQNFYSRTLAVTLRHKWWTALAIVLVLASAAIPMMLVKSDMFPQGVGRNLFITYHLNGNYPLDRVESAVSTVEAYLEKNRERFGIQTIYSYFRPDDAGTFVSLVPKGSGLETREVLDQITEEMPEIIIGKPSFQFDQQAGEGFSLQLSGDSTEQLAELSFELARQLRAVEGLESVRSEARDGEEEIQIIVDRQRASQLGLTTGDVAASVAAAMRGDKLKEFRGTDREVDMRLTFRESDRQNVEDLATLPLYLPSGERITLGAVADFRQVRGAREIKRVNRLTAVIVAGNLAKGATLDEVKKRVEPLMEQFAMPPGFTWKFGRGFETDDKTQQIMLQAILLGVAVIFLVMAALFESALHPLSILTSIIFAVVGMYWFFLVTGTTMTFMSMVGLMILVGVVVNIGIVLVAHINNLRAAGLSRDEAIIQAGRDRLRPILMTTMTTLLAMSALALGDAQVGGDGGGGGGPAYSPMARAIIGGLAFSSVLSLYAVPAFYEWFDDLNQWRRRIRGVARGRLVERAAPLAAQRNST
ncbi:MAG TPA: efflux RND transporter permease subunit [Steroidobacteraceae bacterium]|nr:efflux RND transporter permease subunit [Steroidobacteraceae bacterium]